jgi:hypothetical protein
MEYGLRLARASEPPRDFRDACPPAWRALLPDGRAVALYFGTEFCEDLLPDADEAGASCAIAREHGLEATLLTPLVTPAGLRRIDHLLSQLAAQAWRPAVVFNDWGVLGLLRERHPALPRRAGRLMNRSLRDARVYREAPAGTATHDGARCERLRRHLASAGVCALETDPDLDGGYLGDGPGASPHGLARALHVPFVFAASGRNCPIKALVHPEGRGFTHALAEPCPAPCRAGPVEAPRADSPLLHWRGGNTLFYEVPHEAARSWFERTERIVLHEAATP